MNCINCGCNPINLSKGRIINRIAWLGSEIVKLRQLISQLEKQSRKTPPKTLIIEWCKVEQAKIDLEVTSERLEEFIREQKVLKELF